jgi:hypothetical protein
MGVGLCFIKMVKDTKDNLNKAINMARENTTTLKVLNFFKN